MFAGDPAPFVMELPVLSPSGQWGSVLRSMWERGWSFIKKAGTDHPAVHNLRLVYVVLRFRRRSVYDAG